MVDEADDSTEQTITNVSLGGLAIVSDKPIAQLERVRISIPMLGSVESLNVSVAAAVCLYEIVRRRSPS